jgi:hypothetical protein
MSIKLAISRFKEMHDDFKAGAFKSPDALKFYMTERDAFMAAVVQAQQLTIKPGQAPRQAFRVTRTERLVLMIGPRREATVTLDLAIGGMSAMVGPLAAGVACEFELGTPPELVKGRARVVASVKLPDGSYRTSFAIDRIAESDKTLLETWAIDAALEVFGRR